MSLDITDIEEQRIQSYLRCELSPADKDAFEADLQSNPDLRQKAALLARLTRATAEVGAEQDQALTDALQATDRGTIERLTKGPKPHRALALRWWMTAAAAVVLLLVGLNRGIERHRLTTLGLTYAIPFEQTNEVRGEMEPYEEEICGLYRNVIDGEELDATIDRLRVLYEMSILDEENRYTELSFPIGWYLTCAYLQQGQRQAAIDQLHRLQAHDIDKQIEAEKIQELLDQIE